MAVAKKCRHCGKWLEEKNVKDQHLSISSKKIIVSEEIENTVSNNEKSFLSKQIKILFGCIAAVLIVIVGIVCIMNKPSIEKADKLLANRNINSGINMLIDLSNEGDTIASYRLYTYYRDGKYVRSDYYKKAQDYLKLSAKQGHPCAKKRIAYNNIEEIETSIAAATDELLRNFENNDLNLYRYNLENHFNNIKKQFDSSEYIKDIANTGDMKCQYYYGLKLLMDPTSRIDAVDLLERSKEQGCQEALIILAECYLNAVGVEKDTDKSIEYGKKCVISGKKRMALTLLYDLLTIDVEQSY